VSESAPLWKQAYDAFQKAVAPELENLVRQQPFQDLYANGLKAQRRLQQQAARSLQQVWRLWGLGTTDDVARLSAQVATLEQELRDLRRRAEEAAHGASDVRPRRDRSTPAA
jgi:hypothetical protein